MAKKKIRDPAMPLYVADWLSSQAVTAMPLEDQGAFVRLLCHAWLSGDCSLPDDDQALASLSSLGDRWHQGSGDRIRLCFVRKRIGMRTKLINKKQHDVWVLRRNYAERGRKGGLTSGDVRRSETKQTRSKPSSKLEAKSNITITSTITSTEEKESLRSLAFERFWECYPRRGGKIVGKAASKALFAKLDADDAELCILAATHYARSTTATEGFAKDPERFLKKDFWRDWLEPQVLETPSRVAGPEDWKTWNPTDAGLGARA